MVSQLRPAHLNRYRQIASALVRHGLGYLLDFLGLERFVSLGLGRLGLRLGARGPSRPESANGSFRPEVDASLSGPRWETSSFIRAVRA